MLISLKTLLATGNVDTSIDIAGNVFSLRLLDTQSLQLAFDAARGVNSVSRTMDSQRQVLSRSIVSVNGSPTFVNPNVPTTEEIENMYQELGSLHVFVIDKLWDAYDKMEQKVSNELEDAVKK